MHIIICGAGQVGFSIAEHLAVDNDITIIDSDAEKLRRATDAHGIRGFIGTPSNPDVLQEAGTEDADMIIAVTESDEINMVACQMAHSIFNTPIKIARIRSRSYLNPIAADLFGPENIPIDHIISPEAELSEAVSRRLLTPGAFDVATMSEGKIRIVGVKCLETCPILGEPLRRMPELFEDLNATVTVILRDNEIITPRDGTSEMQQGDRVYFVCDEAHMARAMALFGHEEAVRRRVLIAGGGTIGQMVAASVLSEIENSICTIIEHDKETANQLAHQLPNATVLNGNALDPDILNEGAIRESDTFVALTNDDEVNVLSSLLSRRFGGAHTVTLVNLASFVPLISTLGVDAVVSPPAITVASILKHVRRGRVRDIHTIVEDKGEFMEVEAMPSSPLVGKPLRDASIHKSIVIGAIVRNGEVLQPRGDTVIEAEDQVILFTMRGAIGEVEKLLSVRPDFF